MDRGPTRRGGDHVRPGGVGGTFAGTDSATGIAFALTKNRLSGDTSAVEEALGIVREAAGGRSPAA